jgi:hypothetical protein
MRAIVPPRLSRPEKDRSEVDARRQQKTSLPVISERAVGTPKWQLKSGEGRHFFGTAGLDGARNRRR